MPEQDVAIGTDMQVRKLGYEILLGIALLCVSVSCVIWVYSMVYAASEVGSMERKDIKQWSLVLVLLSVTTLFIGSVGGYLIGKYLHVSHGQPEFSGMTN
ncbi:MAG: hypothetical protein ABSG57_00965 [Candidatus Bathyarchaeia archaeon]